MCCPRPWLRRRSRGGEELDERPIMSENSINIVLFVLRQCAAETTSMSPSQQQYVLPQNKLGAISATGPSAMYSTIDSRILPVETAQILPVIVVRLAQVYLTQTSQPQQYVVLPWLISLFCFAELEASVRRTSWPAIVSKEFLDVAPGSAQLNSQPQTVDWLVRPTFLCRGNGQYHTYEACIFFVLEKCLFQHTELRDGRKSQERNILRVEQNKTYVVEATLSFCTH